MPATPLRLDHLTVGHDATGAVHDITTDLPATGITAVLGANGSGKSTLLETIARILQPLAGTVLLDGHDVHRTPTRQVATRLSILTQDPPIPAGLTARALVAYGRSPHHNTLHRPPTHDRDIVEAALAETGTTSLADTPLQQLSGGQRQRVRIAMALAQDTPTILLDEPTAFLDIEHQLDILTLLRTLADTRDKHIIMVVHDIDHALGYADHVLIIDNGTITASGPPAHVITPDLLLRTFHVHAHIHTTPDGRLHCTPYALARDDTGNAK